jgi:hypothetical protein
MLMEGIMAIQRIIDQEGIPNSDSRARVPLHLDHEPTWQPSPQPVDVSIGAT